MTIDNEYSQAMPVVARLLLGDPNPEHSKQKEWRYGNRGSLAVNLDRATWYDHEAGEGGGVLDLIRRETGHENGAAMEWLQKHVTGAPPAEIPRQNNPRGRIVATYRYEDENRKHLFDVLRFEPKDFRQRAPNGDWSTKGIRRVLYRLPQILEAPSGSHVYLVEGEKDVELLTAHRLFATTCPGGAGKWRDDYANSLAGKPVVIVPDNDKPGRDHAEKVRVSLARAGVACAVVVLPGLHGKQDVSDWIAMGHTVDDLDALAVKALEAADVPDSGALFSPASRWADKAVPPRNWLVSDLIPARQVTLLGGDGGTGKSLLALQLAVATAAGTAWVGRSIARAGTAAFLSAEDDEDELHRRCAAVCDAESLPLAQTERLLVRSLAGQDALLATLEKKSNCLIPTPLFERLDDELQRVRPELLVLDTLADLHAGDENNRSHARQFIGMLRGLAMRNDCAVVVLSHPSLSGMASGSGLSGSTAWNGSVRSRLYLERVTNEGHEPDPDARRMSNKKSNYGRLGIEIELAWSDGVFKAVGRGGALDRIASAAKAERVFLKLLREFTAQGRDVRVSTGHGSAPAEFLATGRAEGCTKQQLRHAMEALLGKGAIKQEENGPLSRRTKRLVEVAT